MNKREVIISIKPTWCKLIANGEKVYEIRKRAPKEETPFKAYIYCSMKNTSDPQQYMELHTDKKIYKCNGHIIGEFICDDIVCLKWAENSELQNVSKGAKLSIAEISNYGGVYAWHISHFKIYDAPKNISEFGLIRAPQSWAYSKKILDISSGICYNKGGK